MTTAQSFPLTPTDVMLAEVMALKAYSEITLAVVPFIFHFTLRTDLIEATLIREDGNVSVEARAACTINY